MARYKVKPDVKMKRLAKLKELHNQIWLENQNAEERLFISLKELIAEQLSNQSEKIYNIILDILEKNSAIILDGVKDIYNGKIKSVIVELQDILYDGDNKTLKERIDYWVNQKLSYEMLFVALCRIIDTETECIYTGIQRKKVNALYVEIIGEASCEEEGGPCVDFIEEIKPINSMTKDMWPPYHPLCACFPIFYVEDEVEVVE